MVNEKSIEDSPLERTCPLALEIVAFEPKGESKSPALGFVILLQLN